MTSAPSRVLHVLGSLERGGVESWLLNLGARLDPRQCHFDFCTLGPTSGRYASLARSRGSQVIPCPVGSGRGPADLASFALRLYRIFRAGDYPIVHSHVHHFSSLVLAVAHAAGVTVRIAHSHNTHDGAPDLWPRALYRAAAARLLEKTATLNLACSADAAASLFGRDWQADPKVRVLHYGLNGSLQAPPPDPQLRAQFGIEPATPVVGHVGRFDRQKNHEFLLEIASVLKKRRFEARWLLVGDGPRRREIECLARRLGLGADVLFCGRREDVDALMSSAMDAFVLPSLHEGLPLVLLEAQAAGLRSLAAARVTREAAVVEGAVDFLPLEAGPEVWADHTVLCLERGRLCPRLARTRLEVAGFTIDQSRERLLEAYRWALVRERMNDV